MKKALALALGIVTSIGGFLDMGALATSSQAGANYRFQLLWAIAIATLLVIFLVEMSGRFAAATSKALPDAIREHFGFTFWLIPFLVLTLSHLLVLGTEIGGICFALHLISGLPTPLWAVPVGVLLWFFLWRSTFNTIENSTSLLGLITLAFVVAAVAHHPPVNEMLAGFVPTLPEKEPLKYWAIAVSIVGAVLSPYLFYFYSSGAVEDDWNESYIPVNRAIATLGMGFGSVVAMGALVVGAMVLAPRGIAVDDYHQAALMLTEAFPFWGFLLFAVGLGIACVAASLEVALSMAYAAAQTFGWNWGESLNPREDARFSTVYTVFIALASLIILIGVDPLKLTILAMATEAAVLPFVAIPFLILMNDRKLLKDHANGWISNSIAVIVLLLAVVLTVVSIPLAFLGGGG
ncbi:MAG TPA: Nramp family divalent metal transporter [Thermoanaerobaculia bacterium]|jgi:NRAMP (natural resistance-associated macrophage protein)-like metal ion transporter|nr:Nramp family divalent metal transporter [Thermoanaerobaculia bacterium]